jgi:thiol-disulfide isomerase/thioredoxin
MAALFRYFPDLKQIAGALILFLVFFSGLANSEPIEQFTQKVADYQGQVIYVDFWASWCVPCRKSFPWMNSMQQQYQSKGFKVLSINLDANQEKASAFLAEYSANFDVVFDPSGKIAKKFQLAGMPSSFIIDRKGKIVSAHVGFTNEKKMKYEQEIITLLAQ